MILYFQDSAGKERELAKVDDEKEALSVINKFCEERNFKIHYIRTWVVDNRRWYDVGSWSEFFILEYWNSDAFASDQSCSA